MLGLLAIAIGFILGVSAAAPRSAEDETRSRVHLRQDYGPLGL
jgi:hypothetical protein